MKRNKSLAAIALSILTVSKNMLKITEIKC